MILLSLKTVRRIVLAACTVAAVGAAVPNTAEAAILQCVQYARTVTNVPLKGDAWTWWNKAPGVRLPRGQDPEAGGILVFSKTKRLPRGHVSVVTGILNSREIVVSHANWAARGTARGRVEQDVRVLDVSPMNDWSEVRVWYAPSDSYGQRVYPTYGFIYTLEALPGL